MPTLRERFHEKRDEFLSAKRESVQSRLLALSVGLLSVVLLFVSEAITVDGQGRTWPSLFLLHVGAFGSASVAMGVIFNYWQAKNRRREFLHANAVADSWKRASITRVLCREDKIEWPILFDTTRTVRLMFAFKRSWRSLNRKSMRTLLSRPGTEIQAVLPKVETDSLPNGTSSALVQYAEKFGVEETYVVRQVARTKEMFDGLRAETHRSSSVCVYEYDAPFEFSAFIFDCHAVFVSHSHQEANGTRRFSSLVLIGNRGGELYDWLEAEWEAVRAAADDAVEPPNEQSESPSAAGPSRTVE